MVFVHWGYRAKSDKAAAPNHQVCPGISVTPSRRFWPRGDIKEILRVEQP